MKRRIAEGIFPILTHKPLPEWEKWKTNSNFVVKMQTTTPTEIAIVSDHDS